MKISQFRHSRAGFTLLELIVGMTIFALAITSIFVLLQSTLKSVAISRSEIIVSNLLREQIELTRNVRDSNWKKFALWDNAKIVDGNETKSKLFDGTFIIENNFDHSKVEFSDPNTSNSLQNQNESVNESVIVKSPVKITKITDLSSDDDISEKFEKTQLCFDNQKRYVHCGVNNNEKTPFASYIIFSPLEYTDASGTKQNIRNEKQEQGFIIDARVIVKDGAHYREYDAKTAITDWKK